jgi:SAM-dependent methyltransferase
MNTGSLTVISSIQSGIASVKDPCLYKETNFNNRADAIDFIEFNIIDRIDGLLQNADIKNELNVLKHRAEKFKRRLQKIDADLFIRLREKIRNSTDASTTFNEIIRQYAAGDFNYTGGDDEPGYDNLDIFINGLLSQHFMPAAIPERKPGMVFFQKTPARIVFQMAALMKLNCDDVFFDIGSGLGQVAILVNLLGGTKATGIEYEAAYCDYAKECAAQLNLHNVEFINANAVDVNYSAATVLFVYTPFEGNMLKEMVEVLRKAAQRKPIRLFTYGPCSSFIAAQPWLECINGTVDDAYKLYAFKSLDTAITGKKSMF